MTRVHRSSVTVPCQSPPCGSTKQHRIPLEAEEVAILSTTTSPRTPTARRRRDRLQSPLYQAVEQQQQKQLEPSRSVIVDPLAGAAKVATNHAVPPSIAIENGWKIATTVTPLDTNRTPLSEASSCCSGGCGGDYCKINRGNDKKADYAGVGSDSSKEPCMFSERIVQSLSCPPRSQASAPIVTDTQHTEPLVFLTVVDPEKSKGDKYAGKPRPLRVRDWCQWIEKGHAVVFQQQRVPQVGKSHSNQTTTTTSRLVTACRRQPGLYPIVFSNTDFLSNNDNSHHPHKHHNELLDSWLGRLWRWILCWVVLRLCDSINALRLARALVPFAALATAMEALLLAQLMEALDGVSVDDVEEISPLDSKQQLAVALSWVFQNRNMSRVLVQNLFVASRFNFFWHWSTAIIWNRWMDFLGLIIPVFAFPATENAPNNTSHALASIFRILLGEGRWLTRVVTRGRQELVLDHQHAVAQNLTAESNNFETSQRNQYGTHYGRLYTNRFRVEHRLPVDESLVRTFGTRPTPTMTNNGAVHTLRQLVNHWTKVLEQGTFAHQRMEQLDPLDTLRFHMPQVLTLLCSLRGRNVWDSRVVGPLIRQCENVKLTNNTQPQHKQKQHLREDWSPESECNQTITLMAPAKRIIRELHEVALDVTGGIASVLDPFREWLSCLSLACNDLEKEAFQVYKIISSVELGIRLGYDVLQQVNWKVPKDHVLKRAITRHILQKVETPPVGVGDANVVSEQRVRRALQLTTPRDKRTLIELIKLGLGHTKPARLLLNRVKTLLQRELRRELLNRIIRDFSIGEYLRVKDDDEEIAKNEWYWLEDRDGRLLGTHIFSGDVLFHGRGLFTHVNSGFVKEYDLTRVRVRRYVPVAESIVRAQKAYMTIELKHGKRFTYSAFMEFSFLRVPLRRLMAVAQMACEELDNARLNILQEVKRFGQVVVSEDELVPGETYYVVDRATNAVESFVFCEDKRTQSLASLRIVRILPQNVIVVGGGPTGLLTCIHCAESCLAGGGALKLLEARDAFAKGGSSYERAQIVRLDARWIAMLRYHLGTSFEDHFISLSGETDSQLGNTLPTQGFIEITIKDLENMLHVEVSRLWSRGIVNVFTDSKAQYDLATNSLTKFGENLKVNDIVRTGMNPDGKPCMVLHSWRVVDLHYAKPLNIKELRVGEEYGVFDRAKESILPYKLVRVDLETKTYIFWSLSDQAGDLKVHERSLPSVYPAGTDSQAHANVRAVRLECLDLGKNGKRLHVVQFMRDIRNKKFSLDVGHSHVIEAIGKPHDSTLHFLLTTPEPYGTCCLQGLKVSMGMHNLGEKRWGSGILDDFRSVNDQNTRVVGDFTKMIRVAPILHCMSVALQEDSSWQAFFENIVTECGFAGYLEGFMPQLIEACNFLKFIGQSFVRPTLQTRFFETGDNFYLGMEFNREFDRWKQDVAKYFVAQLVGRPIQRPAMASISRFRASLMHGLDRLFFAACITILKSGDVYNPGGRHRVPEFRFVCSFTHEDLGSIPVGELFSFIDDPGQAFEVLAKFPSKVAARSVEGEVSLFGKRRRVRRESNLTRAPDGRKESKVAVSSFAVGHFVHYRAMKVLDREHGYVIAFSGDSQATPHFMRYSGLTGSGINAVSFNTFIESANDGITFAARYRKYICETNWSNCEVVQRGTAANYGHGFMRPGFPYSEAVAYLSSKLVECWESGQHLNDAVSNDWKQKFAASLVPRGFEMNEAFRDAVKLMINQAIFDRFLLEASAKSGISTERLSDAFQSVSRGADFRIVNFDAIIENFEADSESKRHLIQQVGLAKCVTHTFLQILDYAAELFLYNKRYSSEMFNQPKSVDSIVDDFAVEAQSFANSLTLSTALVAFALSFRLTSQPIANVISFALGVVNIPLSFGTMTNAARYRIRNEEACITFCDEKLSNLKRRVFSLMDQASQDQVERSNNPFIAFLDEKVQSFSSLTYYYGFDKPRQLLAAYEEVSQDFNDLKRMRAFQLRLCTEFVPGTYQGNAYLQESLVNLYNALEEILRLSRLDFDRKITTAAATLLFDRLLAFEPRLAASVQRGAVRWGFVRQRSLARWDVVEALRYVVSPLGLCRSSPLSLENEIQSILKLARALSIASQSKLLRREIHDLEVLYWATRESSTAALIMVSSSSVFASSVLITLARICAIDYLERIAFWTVVFSAFGAILASFHFARKLIILVNLWFSIGKKTKKDLDSDKVCAVRTHTSIQIALTCARLLAGVSASIALPFSVAEQGFREELSTPMDLPFWIALGSLSAAVGATLFFFFVEFMVRYNLHPRLGQLVCECFRNEIESSYDVMTLDSSRIEMQKEQERETWEYTAREFLHRYRFDTVFAADRFGQILQYIQGGVERKKEMQLDA